jgi:hypothetical protein
MNKVTRNKNERKVNKNKKENSGQQNDGKAKPTLGRLPTRTLRTLSCFILLYNTEYYTNRDVLLIFFPDPQSQGCQVFTWLSQTFVGVFLISRSMCLSSWAGCLFDFCICAWTGGMEPHQTIDKVTHAPLGLTRFSGYLWWG